MNDSARPASSAGAKVVRWTARIISAAVLAFFGFFIIAHIFGHHEPRATLAVSDYVSLVAMGVALAGLALAWWKEGAGGLTTLVAFAVLAVVNWRVLTFPFVLVLVGALLFIASAWMRRAGVAAGGASVQEEG